MKSASLPVIVAALVCISFMNADWITYTGKDGLFKIKFPGQPKELTSAPRYGNLGSMLISFNPEKNTDENLVYWLNVTDYPEDKISSDKDKQEQFLTTQASVLIMMIGKVLSEEDTELNGFKGKFLTGEILSPPAELHNPVYVKAFLVKNRVFQLMVSCKPDKKDNPFIKAFFDSFEITGQH